MESLFIFNPTDYSVEISPELTFITPFRKLINRDRSKYKKRAKGELAYIYLVCDFKSPYRSTINVEERKKNVIDALIDLSDDWVEDKLVTEAMDYYVENNKTIASIALEHQRNNVHNLITRIGDFINSSDIAEIQKAVVISEKIEGLISSIDKLEKIVKGERESKDRHKGSQDKSMMEDGVF